MALRGGCYRLDIPDIFLGGLSEHQMVEPGVTLHDCVEQAAIGGLMLSRQLSFICKSEKFGIFYKRPIEEPAPLILAAHRQPRVSILSFGGTSMS